MTSLTLRRIGWIGASLGLTSVLVGCNDIAPDSATGGPGATSSQGYLTSENGLNGLNGLNAVNGLNSANGLNAVNGLNSANGLGSVNGLNSVNGFNSTNGFNSANGWTSNNGLNSVNGLNSANGLNSVNGLAAGAGMMTTDMGRKTVSYLVRCALDAGDTLVKQDQNNVNYTFAGAIGLAPQYKTAGCNKDCTEELSACLMAHINTSGVHIPLWLDSPMTSVGWGQSPWFPTQEGAFFGQIFLTNTSNNLDAYYCNGRDVDSNEVPGRIGGAQSGVPYANAYPTTGGACATSGHCVMQSTDDGAVSCVGNGTTWTHPITVWRGQTFQAEGAEGGQWFGNYGAGCTPGTSGCSWVKGVANQQVNFIAGNCTPGSNGCAIIADPKNGKGQRVGYIGPGKGVKFVNANVACGGSGNLVVYTTNGDALGSTNRHLSFVVNGGSPQDVTFTGNGNFNGSPDWSNPVGATVSLTGFTPGATNTIYVTGNATNPAPDLDWIEVVNSGTSCQASAQLPLSGATASSNYTSAYDQHYAIDGNMTTRWSSNFTDNEWIYVDLGSVKTVTQVKINWEAAYGKNYTIEVSSDAVNWTVIKTVTNGTGGTDDLTGLSGTGRYVRMHGSLRGISAGYSIWEMNVFGY